MVIRSQSITAPIAARIGKRVRRPTFGGVGIKPKSHQIKLKFPSKTKRKLAEAKARAKVRREARVKRLAQEALSKQERANLRASKRLQRLKNEALDKLASKARARGRSSMDRIASG